MYMMFPGRLGGRYTAGLGAQKILFKFSFFSCISSKNQWFHKASNYLEMAQRRQKCRKKRKTTKKKKDIEGKEVIVNERVFIHLNTSQTRKCQLYPLEFFMSLLPFRNYVNSLRCFVGFLLYHLLQILKGQSIKQVRSNFVIFRQGHGVHIQSICPNLEILPARHQLWWRLRGFDVCTGLPKKTLDTSLYT